MPYMLIIAVNIPNVFPCSWACVWSTPGAARMTKPHKRKGRISNPPFFRRVNRTLQTGDRRGDASLVARG